jgi:hypothetical protein
LQGATLADPDGRAFLCPKRHPPQIIGIQSFCRQYQRPDQSRLPRHPWSPTNLKECYTGATNTSFTRAGGSIAEYTAGMAYATAQKWLKIDSFASIQLDPFDRSPLG